MKQIHYIYKLTFLKGSLKGYYYIGKRTSTIRTKKMEWANFSDPIEWAKNDVMFDNYTGSGRVPRDYFKKYGKEIDVTFNKEIIYFSNTFEENALIEENIIGDSYKTDPKCVNLVKGGMCGDPSKLSDEERKIKYKRILTEEGRKRLSEFHKERCSKIPMPWKGKKRTDEEKKKISEKVKKYWENHPELRKKEKHFSKSGKERNSIAHKKLWENNEYREKVTNSLKEYWATHKSPNFGTHLSKERKNKLSEYFKGRPNPKNKGENNGMYGKTPANVRKVIQLTIDDIFIKEWKSLKEAADSLGLHSSNILKVCSGERKKCGGFHWKYK